MVLHPKNANHYVVATQEKTALSMIGKCCFCHLSLNGSTKSEHNKAHRSRTPDGVVILRRGLLRGATQLGDALQESPSIAEQSEF
jgi:hypothetical protein